MTKWDCGNISTEIINAQRQEMVPGTQCSISKRNSLQVNKPNVTIKLIKWS